MLALLANCFLSSFPGLALNSKTFSPEQAISLLASHLDALQNELVFRQRSCRISVKTPEIGGSQQRRTQSTARAPVAPARDQSSTQVKTPKDSKRPAIHIIATR